ncbi:malonate--CoA ligase [Salinarimonas sp.]|uniref:malonate--CoA ligase n=1 Tax=Salinarimonas sp. TaxID=2766526 RepID=UPI00391A506C
MPSHLYAEIEAAARDPDKVLIETQDGRAITYRQAFAHAGRFANALRALGVEVGDRVAVQVEKSPEVILLLLGCLRAGAVFLPLNTAYTPAELDYFLSDAEPALLVCDPAAKPALAEIATRRGVGAVETLDARGEGSLADKAAAASPDFADAERGPDDLAAILYTSGTTGRSKGAMLTHENLASNARTLRDTWAFTARDVLIHALPTFHTHGLFTATNTILFSGASMLFLPKFDADEILRLMPRATSMMGVPTFYVRLLQHEGLTSEATAHMRLFVSGSAPLLAETHRAFAERTGHAILERYGMTETNMNTSNPYEGERIAGTVGFPLPGIDLRVVDPQTGEGLATDEIGMIEVRGPNVFKGYWRNPEKTKAEFREDGFFVTGDLGKIDPRGYVHIVGRGKDLVITGGYNVYPKEVESEIDALPGVVESAVFGVPHPDLGEGVTAAIVLEPGASLDEAQVKAALADRLARFKQPKRVIVLPELPRNTMGKVQKAALRERYAGLYAGGGAAG